jgi:hypothetical protein
MLMNETNNYFFFKVSFFFLFSFKKKYYFFLILLIFFFFFVRFFKVFFFYFSRMDSQQGSIIVTNDELIKLKHYNGLITNTSSASCSPISTFDEKINCFYNNSKYFVLAASFLNKTRVGHYSTVLWRSVVEYWAQNQI